MKIFLNTLLLLFSCAILCAQVDAISLTNPSFEGDGQLNTRLPRGCIDCGFVGESPPDVHPANNGTFEVKKTPSHGKTYLGMVVRDNDTWERVSIKLSSTLEKGQCYSFSIDLARSEIYSSYSRMRTDSMIKANYIKPAKLRIYGGKRYCARAEMIGETSLIRNTNWFKYFFIFQPKENYQHITFEAFYNTPTLIPYNGNILMDNASDFILMPCDKVIKTND